MPVLPQFERLREKHDLSKSAYHPIPGNTKTPSKWKLTAMNGIM